MFKELARWQSSSGKFAARSAMNIIDAITPTLIVTLIIVFVNREAIIYYWVTPLRWLNVMGSIVLCIFALAPIVGYFIENYIKRWVVSLIFCTAALLLTSVMMGYLWAVRTITVLPELFGEDMRGGVLPILYCAVLGSGGIVVACVKLSDKRKQNRTFIPMIDQ